MAAADYYTQVYTMFVGYFGRPPAQSGLDYYANLVNAAGGKLNAVLDDFHKAAESQALFAGKSIEQQVNIIFQNLFGRDAAPAGLNYWAGEIAAGRLALSQAAYAIAQGAQTADKGVLTAKIDSAKLWVAGLDTTTEILIYGNEAGRTAGRDFLKTVTTSTPAAQTAVDAALKAMVDGGNTNPGQTFTLTTGIDSLTGTAGNDTFVGEATGGVNTTMNAADSINGGAGTDRANLFLSGADGQITSSNLEAFYLQASGAARAFSASNVTGATQMWNNSSTSNLTVTNVGSAVTVGSIGGPTTAAGAGTTTYEVEFTAAAVAANPALQVVLQGSNLAALNVGDTTGAAEFTTMTITGTGGNSSIGVLNDGSGAAVADLRTLNVKGDSRVSIDSVLTGVTKIDASASTGGARVIIDTGADVAFTGGTGADRVDIGATGLSSADVINGGDGTDTLRVSGATQLDAAGDAPNAANIKGFETLEVRDNGGNATVLASILATNNTITSVIVSGGNGGATTASVTAIAAGAKDAISIALTDETDNVTLSVAGQVTGGLSDTATVTLNNNTAGAATDADGIDVATLTFTNVDQLTVKSVAGGTYSSTDGIVNSIAALTAVDLDKLTVEGNEDVAITFAATTLSVGEVDASALTGRLTFNDGSPAAGSTALLVRGGTQSDTITIGTAGSIGTVFLGAREVAQAETVTFDGGNGATGTNSVNFTATTLGSGDVTAGQINLGFNTAVANDLIRVNFSAGIEALLKVNNSALSAVVGNVTTFSTVFDANNNIRANFAADVWTIDIDLDGNGLYSATSDLTIQLTGVAAGADTLIYDATNDFFLFTAV